MSVSLYTIAIKLGNNNVGMTEDGGLYQTFINDTGAASVKGTIVIPAASIDNGVDIAPAESHLSIGVIYEDGIANGSDVKVIFTGKAQVLLASTETSTRGYWCGVSKSEQGRMYQLDDSPAVIGDIGLQVGHSLQQVGTAGSLAWVDLQFN